MGLLLKRMWTKVPSVNNRTAVWFIETSVRKYEERESF